jgi:hypothetical protein
MARGFPGSRVRWTPRTCFAVRPSSSRNASISGKEKEGSQAASSSSKDGLDDGGGRSFRCGKLCSC